MSDVIQFPGGVITNDEEKVPTIEEVISQTMSKHKLKIMVMVGMTEDNDEIVISGNSTISQGVYLLEAGKQMLING